LKAAWAALLFSVALGAGGADSAPPTGPEILAAVVAGLPAEPLCATGTLTVRKRHGVVVSQFGFAFAVNWGSRPAVARYTIRDAFGREAEQLTVSRAPGAAPRFEYASGTPLAAAPCPDLFAPIQGSDVSWSDLALSFLWWPDGTLAGEQEVLGRSCYVVEVPAPKGTEAPGGAGGCRPSAGAYQRVRLWIDREMLMLLQAEGLDGEGRPLRRVWVKSFKKIGERWMVKDLEVQQFPSPHRTKLTIQEVRSVGGSWASSS
jgi:hypothetical protein